jgi:hypothetical protein
MEGKGEEAFVVLEEFVELSEKARDDLSRGDTAKFDKAKDDRLKYKIG